MKRFFTDHPAEVGESYGEHFAVATGTGWRMVAAGAACMIHGVLPFAFKNVGSGCIRDLHRRMDQRRRARGTAPRVLPAE